MFLYTFHGGLPPSDKDGKGLVSQVGMISVVLLSWRCFEVSAFIVNVKIHIITLAPSPSLSSVLPTRTSQVPWLVRTFEIMWLLMPFLTHLLWSDISPLPGLWVSFI